MTLWASGPAAYGSTGSRVAACLGLALIRLEIETSTYDTMLFWQSHGRCQTTKG